MTSDNNSKFNKAKLNLVIDAIMFVIMLSIFTIKGEMHEAFAYTLGVLVISHIVMHWKQIRVMYRQLIPGAWAQKLVAALFLILTAAVLLIPCFYPSANGPNGNQFRGASPYGNHGNNH